MYTSTALIAAVPFASALLAVVLFGLVWPGRRRPSAASVLCVLAACAVWAFFYGVEIAAADFRAKVVAAQLQYAGISFVAPSWCIAAVHSSGRSRVLTRRRVALLLVVPVIALAAALTNPLHGLLWREISERTSVPHTLDFVHGPVFWLNLGYAWLTLAAGTLLLLRNIVSSHALYFGQRVLLMATVVLPWLANAAYIAGAGPVPGLDLTPCAFVVSGFILYFAIVRYRIADVVPIARDFVLENINEALFVFDTDNKLIDINRAGRELLGGGPGATIGGNARDAFARVPALADMLRSRQETKLRFDVVSGAGSSTYEARVDTLMRGPGIRLGRVVTCRDITREVQAADELRERENRYRVLFEESPIALWLEDFSGVHAFIEEARQRGVTDWRAYFENDPEAVRACAERVTILDVNAQAIAQHGAHDKDDLLSNLESVFTDQSFEVFRDELVALAQGQTSFSGEAEHRSVTGKVFWVSVNLRVVPGSETRLDRVLISNIDISERKRAEERRLHLERQVQQAQKLESLGVLAGGIAHDFNNLLVAILGNASLTLEDLSPASPVHESVRAIESAALRAADLCRQMLAYAGKGKFVVEPIDLGAIVQAMMPLLRTSVSKKAELTLNAGGRAAVIEGDATQIEQVVMNLVINASEALGEHVGTIRISIGAETCSRERLAQLPYSEDLPEGDYVFLDVADSGHGMDEDTRARLFEPFFSTKFTGRGLGMSVVLGIVRGHRGSLDVQSVPGGGTRIRALFPAAAGSAKATTMSRAAPAAESASSSSVLLIDDEESVREVAAKMLERIGMTVLTANDGRMALDVFQAHRGAIGLVLLDFKMPQLDGIETYRLLQQIDPNVRVVLSSGYTEHEIAARFTDLGFAGFIQKPYTLDTLRECLVPLLAHGTGAVQSAQF